MLHVIYRLSDNSYNKDRMRTKSECLGNFFWKFCSVNKLKVYILVDTTNLRQETRDLLTVYDTFEVHYVNGGSSAASWKLAFEFAQQFPDDDYVYFVEDDYLHRHNSYLVLMEGLERADYVSLYDHNDKYISSFDGGNPFIDDDGGEATKVFRTKSAHWKLTNSTTMTFATQLKTLRDDADVWHRWTMTGPHPHDFQAFLELNKKGRSLITPIPGWSTHCEERWASPGIDWSTV
jgi:hypothetical protein